MLIECKDVSFAYEDGVVVSGLDFRLDEGDYLCVVGENGSGKSTLVKGLAGLKKPSSGTLKVNCPRSDVGFLPQQSDSRRDFPASVLEVAESGFACEHFGFAYSRAQQKKTLENLALLGMDGYTRHCFRELSGGQRQRVLLARALCAANKLVLLDEPAAGLDPLVTRELYDVVARLNRERSLAVVMVSHDVAAAVKCASHILHVGKTTLFFGTSADYAQSDVGRRYLGGEKNV